MSENKQSRLPALRDFQFMGIPLAMYAVICVILWVSMGFGWLGNSYFTLFASCCPSPCPCAGSATTRPSSASTSASAPC